MNKLAFNGLFGLFVLAITLASCSKEEEQTPLAAGTASVTGRLTANLDETDFQIQSVPEGTGITFVISGADLDRFPQPNYNYEDVVVRGTANADGRYSVTLPATKNAITAQVIFDDFEFDATILTTNDEGFQTAVVERRTFTRPSTSVSIVEGQVLVKDYAYLNGAGNFVPTATIRGVVEAQFIDNVGDPTSIALVNGGSGYSNSNGVPVAGGSGSGMTVNIFTNIDEEVFNVSINNAGSGYTIGDVLTITTGGNNATIEVTNVNPYDEAVPAGVLLTFTVNSSPYKVFTNDLGAYIVKLPTPAAGQNFNYSASVTGADFEAGSVFFENGEFVSGSKIYTFDGVGSQTLSEGSIIELDLTYSRSN